MYVCSHVCVHTNVLRLLQRTRLIKVVGRHVSVAQMGLHARMPSCASQLC